MALEPLLHAFILRYHQGNVVIDHRNFQGVTDQQIQALVDAAPQASAVLDVKAAAENLSLLDKAIALTLLDAINVERQQRGAQPITAGQFVNAVKAKVETVAS